MIEVNYLSEYQSWIPTLAQWYYNEWPGLYPDIHFVNDRLKERTNTQTFPIGLVAVENSAVVGAVTLKEYDITIKGKSPWLSGLLVQKEKRNHGIGKLLINGVLKKAKELGFKTIYLYTDSAFGYYTSLGWTKIETRMHNGKEIIVFEKLIEP